SRIVTSVLESGARLHHDASADDPGYFGRTHIIHGVSAVTGGCLAIRRSVFEKVGGFDEEHFPDALGDVDLCLRVNAAGYRNIWTPHAELRYQQSAPHPPETDLSARLKFQQELGVLRQRWGNTLREDPHYNPNLSLYSEDPRLAWPPRVRRPWTA